MSDLIYSLPEALVLAAKSSKVVRFVARNQSVETFTYHELLERTRHVAAVLKDLSIKPGDRVGIVLRTSPEFYDAFWGTLWRGAIPAIMPPPNLFGSRMEYEKQLSCMIHKINIELVLTSQGLLKRLKPIVEKISPTIECIGLENLLTKSTIFSTHYYPLEGDETALIQFSSGTETSPKPIALSHKQILANAKAIIELIAPKRTEDPENIGVCWLPLHHDMGLIGCLITAVLQPGDMIYLRPETFLAFPELWLQTISQYRATISPAPNSAYAICAETISDLDIEGIDLSCWRYALNGSEFIASETLESFINRFKSVGFRENSMLPVYGLAEAALAVSFSDISQKFRVEHFDPQFLFKGEAKQSPNGIPLTCLGNPLPGYKIRIANMEGKPLDEGLIGRVLVSGPSIMEGYFCDPETTTLVLNNGWLDTGDNGFLLNGSLFLYGRRKEIIVINGRNYSSQVIENAVELSLGRRNISAAVGIGPESGQQEVLKIFVERERRSSKDGDPSIAEKVFKAVGDNIGIPPDEIVVVPAKALPRTTSGKIRYQEIAKQFYNESSAYSDLISRFSGGERINFI